MGRQPVSFQCHPCLPYAVPMPTERLAASPRAAPPRLFRADLAGVLGMGPQTLPAIRSCALGMRFAALTASASRSMTSGGVPVGAEGPAPDRLAEVRNSSSIIVGAAGKDRLCVA